MPTLPENQVRLGAGSVTSSVSSCQPPHAHEFWASRAPTMLLPAFLFVSYFFLHFCWLNSDARWAVSWILWVLDFIIFMQIRTQNRDTQEARNRARRFAPRPILGFRRVSPHFARESKQRIYFNTPKIQYSALRGVSIPKSVSRPT